MRHIIHLSMIAIVALITTGCSGCKPTPTPDPKTDIELCDEAEERLLELGCEEGAPIIMPDGTQVAFTQFCIDTANAGHWLNPRCLMNLKSCDKDEIEACGEHTEQTNADSDENTSDSAPGPDTND